MERVKFIPRDYQEEIMKYIIAHKRCGIWAGMGLGKTVSVLTVINALPLITGDTRPALVLAPLRVAQSTWPDECNKWQHLEGMVCQPITGTADERRLALKNTKAHVFTINYENIPWLMEELNGSFPFSLVVADESTKLKSTRTKQGSVRGRVLIPIIEKVGRWINLTGTPSPNGLQDLWGQTFFLDKGFRLGKSFAAFENRWFCKSHDGWGLKPLSIAQEEIEGKLNDICISLSASDYFDLDEPIVNKIYVELPPKARKLYDEMEEEMFIKLEGEEIEAFGAAAKTNKCLQLANGAVYFSENSDEWKEVHNEKLKALEDIIEEAAGCPVLVAYNFKSDLARLKAHFPKGRVLDKKPSTISAWNRGEIPVLFTHPASAGHGLNLQDGGNIIAFFGHNWNLEEYQQIIGRIGPVRQKQAGHNRPVFIHHIIAKKTVEELVMKRIVDKASVQDILLEAMKQRHK